MHDLAAMTSSQSDSALSADGALPQDGPGRLEEWSWELRGYLRSNCHLAPLSVDLWITALLCWVNIPKDSGNL